MTTKKSKHGGRRRGAGRPRLYKGALRSLHIRLPRAVVDEVGRAAKVHGMSRSQVIMRSLIRALPDLEPSAEQAA